MWCTVLGMTKDDEAARDCKQFAGRPADEMLLTMLTLFNVFLICSAAAGCATVRRWAGGPALDDNIGWAQLSLVELSAALRCCCVRSAKTTSCLVWSSRWAGRSATPNRHTGQASTILHTQQLLGTEN
jgi:uncharacterized membrane protein